MIPCFTGVFELYMTCVTGLFQPWLPDTVHARHCMPPCHSPVFYLWFMLCGIRQLPIAIWRALLSCNGVL